METKDFPENKDDFKKRVEEINKEKNEQIATIRKNDMKQAQRYIVWGVVSVLINLSIFYLLAHTLKIEYQVANFVAWFLSVQCSFWFDKILVFRHKSKRVAKDMSKFYGTRILTFLIESVILWLGISVLGFHEVITKIIGHGLAVIGNYFLSKLVVFRKVIVGDSI